MFSSSTIYRTSTGRVHNEETSIWKESGIMGKSMDSKKEGKKKPAKSLKEKKAEKKSKKDGKI
jgi:hypothetical protein